MNGVTFNRIDGQLGRTAPGEDHISMMLFDTASSAEFPVTEVNSLAEFESKLSITFSDSPIIHYHVSEFFRVAPNAKLYVGCIEDLDDEDVMEQIYALNGKIRQIGIYTKRAIDTDFISDIGTAMNNLALLNMPCSAVLSFKVEGGDLPSLPNIHSVDRARVSVVIGGDGAGRGWYLQGMSFATNETVGVIGATMGIIARSSVNESIFWVAKNNLISDAPYKGAIVDMIDDLSRELDVPVMDRDGSLVSTFTPGQLKVLQDKGYIFLLKHPAKSGTYFNDSLTASVITSDYLYIEANRTGDKADRVLYQTLVNDIGSNVLTDPTTGFILEESAVAIEAACQDAIDSAMRGEISGREIIVPRNQRPAITSQLVVSRKIVVNAVLRNIIVNSSLNISL